MYYFFKNVIPKINLTLLYRVHTAVAALKSEQIQGGYIVDNRDFRYHVTLEVSHGGSCGAAIIAPKHALTAAHCLLFKGQWINGVSPTYIWAKFRDPVSKNDVLVEDHVVKAYMLEQYRKQHLRSAKWAVTDIAVLKLEHVFDYSDFNYHVTPLTLPNPEKDYANVIATITGRGANFVKEIYDQGGNIIDAHSTNDLRLRAANARVWTRKECENEGFVHESLLCAMLRFCKAGQTEGTCYGDSGGALVEPKSNTIIGIMSLGPTGCDESSRPSCYTRVSSYLDFIESAIQDNTTYPGMITKDYDNYNQVIIEDVDSNES